MFTPAPNAVTTVPVNIPVVTEKVPPAGQNILRADSLGLSVLAPGVPVPAHNTGVFDPLQGAPAGGIWTPAVSPGQELLPGAGTTGFQLLLRADVRAAAGDRRGARADLEAVLADQPASEGALAALERLEPRLRAVGPGGLIVLRAALGILVAVLVWRLARRRGAPRRSPRAGRRSGSAAPPADPRTIRRSHSSPATRSSPTPTA